MAYGHAFRGLKSILITAALLASGAAAQAQQACGPRAELIGKLADKYKEQQHAHGAIGNKVVMEVYVAEKGTWTIVSTDVTGRSCILAAGQGWEEMPILLGEGAKFTPGQPG